MDEETVRISAALGNKSLDAPAKKDQKSFTWGDDFHYRALFEQSDDCIFIIRFDLCYLAANPQALKLLGYAASEMIGKPVSEVMALDESHGHDAVLDDTSNLSERILRRKDGTSVPVEISTSIVYDRTSKPTYIQSIVRDISKRKEIERSLQRHAEIMLSISDSTTRLLQATKIDHKIAEVLGSLGQAVGAVACDIIRIQCAPDPFLISTLFEWRKESSYRFDVADIITPFTDLILECREGIFTRDMDVLPARSVAVVPIVGQAGERE